MEEKLLKTFFEESQENIEALEQTLIALESGQDISDDPETLNAVFRVAHTMKGNAGLVGFNEVVDLTHLMEGLLDEMRKGRISPDAEVVGILLTAVDALKVLIYAYMTGETPCRPQEIMNILAQRLGEEPPHSAEDKTASAVANGSPDLHHYYIAMRMGREVLGTGTDPLQLFLELEDVGHLDKVVCHDDALPGLDTISPDLLYLWWEVWFTSHLELGDIKDIFIFLQDNSHIDVKELAEGQQPQPEPKAAKPAPADPAKAKGQAAAAPAPAPVEARPQGKAPAPPKTPAPAKPAAPHPPPAQSPTIRVETDKLDKLVNLVGELVIGVARVNQIASATYNQDLSSAVENLEHISRDLQEQVMRVRMIPVEGTFSRFQRVVRDLASELGKKIRLEMVGTETELDKNVIEQIADPLKHLVRNSADHGLETPDVRAAAGKPEMGTIWLRAYQQEGKIIIEVADDGAGINRQRVFDKAVQRGWISPTAQLSDGEVFAFMFQPGFSTAEKVTEVSGRGVGLDVVRQNIEALRGSVEVESKHGEGTVFRIKLPLTLAIIDGMTASIGEEVITIPLLSIVESVRPQAGDLLTVENRGELVNVRGEYLPLVRLHEVFVFPTERTDPTSALVIIIESISKRFGVLVDDILGEQQAVIKSLEQNYREVEGIAGATILGDGRVSLIIDIHGLEKIAFA